MVTVDMGGKRILLAANAQQAANRIHGCGRFFLWSVIASAMLINPVAATQKWKFDPSIFVSEVYTSNVGLDNDGGESDDLVTDITPSLRISRKGARLSVDADARLQNLAYASNSGLNDSNLTLGAKTKLEAIEDSVFVDSNLGLAQRSINPVSAGSLNTIADSGSNRTVLSYGVSPYWVLHEGALVDGQVRAGVSHTESDAGGLSDSDQFSYSANFVNGRRFSRFSWGLSFSHREDKRSTGSDVSLQSTTVNVSYRIVPELSVFGDFGNEENEFRSLGGEINGSFSTFGLIWTPSRFLSVNIGSGRNSETMGLQWTPSPRTLAHITLAKIDVGRNPGDVWTAKIRHQTRHTIWLASYLEDTTTQQLVIAESQSAEDLVFDILDEILSGNLSEDAISELDFGGEFGTGTLVATIDDVFVRERGSVTVQLNYGKSNVRLSGYQEDRTFLFTLRQDKITGYSASWTWKLSGKTLLKLSSSQQTVEETARSQERRAYTLGLDRKLTERSSLQVRVGRTDQDGTGSGSTFSEDRASIAYRLAL